MAGGAVPASSVSDAVEKVVKNVQVPKGWAVVGADGVKNYVTGETTKQAAKRVMGNAAKKAVPVAGAVGKALPVLEGMNALGSQNYNTSVVTNSKGKKVSFFGDTFSGKANMQLAQSLVNSGEAKNIEEAKKMVAEMGGAKSNNLFDDESWNNTMGIPNEGFDGMDATPPKADTIDNSLESQANAKPGDVVNGKALTQGDINWAKEQMAKSKETEKKKEGKQKVENKIFQENQIDEKESETNSKADSTTSDTNTSKRKTSMMPIISKIVGGLLGGKWGAFGDEHSGLGQAIADAGRMAGYTQGELDMKDADNAYQKEFESYMAGLDVQKQKNITKAMADLYATDPNSKAYMDKQFELQKELQKQGFNQSLISQILGGAITIGGMALASKGLKSDSKTKLKYCLDK